MKKILVIVFMVVGTTTFAQVTDSSGDNKMIVDKAKMIEVQSQKLKTDLGLNDTQTTQIKALFTKQSQDREAKMAEIKALRANGQQLTDSQKAEIKAKIDADKAAMDTQLKEILTPNQYTKWQSDKEARAAELKKLAPKVSTAG